MRGRFGVAALVLTVLAAAGCTSGRTSGVPTPATSTTTRTATGTATTGGASPSRPGGKTPASPSPPGGTTIADVPRFDHVVIAVLENHAEPEIVGTGDAPFLDSLATSGAALDQFYAITHPSEPNYLALFSGSTQGLSDDSCPHTYTGPNLGTALRESGDTFTGYSEDLPAVGYTGCSSGAYARKHNPWADFTDLPSSVNQPMSAFPGDPAVLPTVSFVIPNLDNDMHDGSVSRADEWLQNNLGTYARWAPAHNSLLIVTTDEDDYGHDNHIATIIAGAHVRPGHYQFHTDHYSLLRTLLDSYHLAPFAQAASATAITSIWTR